MSATTDSPALELADALRTVAVNSAYTASRALSKWFKRGVRLTSDGFETVPISEVAASTGDAEEPVIAAYMKLDGDIEGSVLLVFPEKTALSLVDLMIGAPDGTSKVLGELEASCLQETGNIVGSAFTNCLSTWLKVECIPASPTVVHDLATAVIQPLLVDQASVGDEALVSRTEFELDGHQLDWSFLLLPSADALSVMRKQCESDRVRQNALHAIAINGSFNASRSMSKWLRRGVRLSTEGFEKIALRDVCTTDNVDKPVVALHLELGSQLHGHTLMVMSQPTALELVDILAQQEPGTTESLNDMARSCLQETGNIISSAFVNSWAKWLEIHSEPQPPFLHVDMLEAILETMLVEQALVSDEVFMAKTSFSVDGRWFDWEYYVFPSPSSLRLIECSMD
ncbi:MAG: chemotaxis protein CheC [Phycisphaerales bacterium]|nr:chemotaxis protein CheC [Phycisphaerales bacterium]